MIIISVVVSGVRVRIRRAHRTTGSLPGERSGLQAVHCAVGAGSTARSSPTAAAKPTGKKAKGRKSTFASAEDFSEMLEAAADENEGVHPRLAEWEDGRSRKRKRR